MQFPFRRLSMPAMRHPFPPVEPRPKLGNVESLDQSIPSLGTPANRSLNSQACDKFDSSVLLFRLSCSGSVDSDRRHPGHITKPFNLGERTHARDSEADPNRGINHYYSCWFN